MKTTIESTHGITVRTFENIEEITLEPIAMSGKPQYRCSVCNRSDVEICKPAFFAPNNEWEFTEEDSEAEPLSTWCNDCGENNDLYVIDAFGIDRPIVGRW